MASDTFRRSAIEWHIAAKWDSETATALLDAAGRVLAGNRAFLRLAGLGEECPDALCVKGLLTGGDAERLSDLVACGETDWKNPGRITVSWCAGDAGPEATELSLGLTRLQGDAGRSVLFVAEFWDPAALIGDEISSAGTEIPVSEDLTEKLPVGVFSLQRDRNGLWSLPYISPRIETLIGCAKAELADDPMRLFGVAAGESDADLFVSLKRAATKACHWQHRFRSKRVDGTSSSLMAQAMPEAGAGGATLWHGTLTELSEDAATNQELRDARIQAEENQTRLDQIAGSIPEGLYEFRIGHIGKVSLEYLSSGCAELMGVSLEELADNWRGVLRYIPREDVERMSSKIRVAKDTLAPFSASFRVRHPEKGLRWISASVNPEALENGVKFFGTASDATEQVEREAELREARRNAEESAGRLNDLTDNIPGAVYEFNWDRYDGMTASFLSKQMADLHGVTIDAIRDDPSALLQYLTKEDVALLRQNLRMSLKSLAPWKQTYRVAVPGHRERSLLTSALFRRLDDGTTALYGSVFDISEEVAREDELRRAKGTAEAARERLNILTDNLPGGVFEFVMDPCGHMSVPYTSAGFAALHGISVEQFQQDGSTFFEQMDERDLPAIIASIEVSRRRLTPWQNRFRINHPNRGKRWLMGASVPRQRADGSVIWYGYMQDITKEIAREQELRMARKAAEDANSEIRHQALHDPLTALPNRRFFDQALEARRTDDGRYSDVTTIIRVDLDHFKNVNDTLGHEAGDLVLCHVGKVLAREAGEQDFAARVGGDEFVVLLRSGATARDASTLVGRLRKGLAEPISFEGRLCRFGASFGIASTETMGEGSAELLSFADAALYRAKERGRNRLEIFTRDFHEDILLGRRLADEIQAALETGAFIPFFQPQVDSQSFSLSGVEVLARWNHPERGLLPPSEFMKVADQIRVVPEIDRSMFEQTHDSLGRWEAAGLIVPKISFNMSSGRIHDPNVIEALDRFAPYQTRIAFELLESIFLEEESDAFAYHLDAIKDAGIEIEVDDFGSGHASIVGLMHVGPDCLKIDQRLIKPITTDARTRRLVEAIVEIGQALGIRVTAEGVETMDHAHLLRDLGCDTLQGYAFARALSEDRFLEFALEAQAGAAIRNVG